jgi:hypothetical protein
MSEFAFDFSFLFPEPRPANEGREDERRCLAIRKDGSPCRAWAVWNASEQLCAVHLHSTRRKQREMTAAIRKEQARRHSPVCRCDAYDWPHREHNGLCRGPDGPLGHMADAGGTETAGEKAATRSPPDSPKVWAEIETCCFFALCRLPAALGILNSRLRDRRNAFHQRLPSR